MAKPRDTRNEQIRYPDSILTDSGRMVRISSLNPDTKLKIHGRMIRAGDIPMTVATLGCGDVVRGIAMQKGDHVFCDRHQDDERVVEAAQ